MNWHELGQFMGHFIRILRWKKKINNFDDQSTTPKQHSHVRKDRDRAFFRSTKRTKQSPETAPEK